MIIGKGKCSGTASTCDERIEIHNNKGGDHHWMILFKGQLTTCLFSCCFLYFVMCIVFIVFSTTLNSFVHEGFSGWRGSRAAINHPPNFSYPTSQKDGINYKGLILAKQYPFIIIYIGSIGDLEQILLPLHIFFLITRLEWNHHQQVILGDCDCK